MRTLAILIIGACTLFYSSCETDHTSQKYLLNLSDHTLNISYFDSYYYEQVTSEISPQNSLLITETWTRGSQEEGNLSSCILYVEDTVSVFNTSDSTLNFTGDFTNENRWQSQFTSGASSRQVCTFAFVNNDFTE